MRAGGGGHPRVGMRGESPSPQPSPRKRGAREQSTSPKIPVQHAAINFRQLFQVGNRRTLVDGVHGLADQAELDDRTIASDKAGVRGAAAGAQFGSASRHLLDRRYREI